MKPGEAGWPDPGKILGAARRAGDLVTAAARIIERITGKSSGAGNGADLEQLRALSASLADISVDLGLIDGRLESIEADELRDDERVDELEAEMQDLEGELAGIPKGFDRRFETVQDQLNRLTLNADRQELDILSLRRQVDALTTARISALTPRGQRALRKATGPIGTPLDEGDS